MAVIFLDSSGLNALPCGIFVSLNYDNGAQAASGYLLVGGYLDVSVSGAVHYTALFTGTLAPATSQDFYGNANPGADTVVLVNQFSSSTLSTLGWGQAQIGEYPKGWANPDPSFIPIITARANALGSGIALVDNQTQAVRASLRVFTAQNAALDSWIADFFGTFVPRYPNEADNTYRMRALELFGPRNTLAALSNITTAFYAATYNERLLLRSPNIAYDSPAGAYDVSGAYDVYVPPPLAASLVPTIGAWDLQSRPDLAAQYSIAACYFVIVVGFSNATLNWFVDRTYLDGSAYLFDSGVVQTSSIAPDPRLAALINLVKAGGAVPVWQTITISG